MQFNFFFGRKKPASHLGESCLLVGARAVSLRFAPHHRARRYVLRLCPDGAARVTIPRGGSVAEGKRFAERNLAWLEKQLLRQATQPRRSQTWPIGTEILFRGERAPLETGINGEANLVRFGSEIVRMDDASADLRPAIERHLWNLAAPARGAAPSHSIGVLFKRLAMSVTTSSCTNSRISNK